MFRLFYYTVDMIAPVAPVDPFINDVPLTMNAGAGIQGGLEPVNDVLFKNTFVD
jgi:hypothetical protein